MNDSIIILSSSFTYGLPLVPQLLLPVKQNSPSFLIPGCLQILQQPGQLLELTAVGKDIHWNEGFQLFLNKRSLTDDYYTPNVGHSFNKSYYSDSLGVMHQLLWHSCFGKWLYGEHYCKLRETKALWEPERYSAERCTSIWGLLLTQLQKRLLE